jgi:hypothetical protein
VKRSVFIAAPRDDVYGLIASFRTGWVSWSPFGVQRDPTVTFAYEGPDSGIGAIQRWTAKHMGTGVMRMTHAAPASGIGYTIALTAAGLSFEGEASIDLLPSTEGSTVTWTSTMDLSSSRAKRAFGAVIRRGMGQAFDEGLASLKRAAEKTRIE